MKPIIALTAAALFVTGSGQAIAQEFSQRTKVVPYADLDLTSSAGRETLQRRIARAVDYVCPAPDTLINLRAVAEQRACQRETSDRNNQQVAMIYGRGGVLLAEAPTEGSSR